MRGLSASVYSRKRRVLACGTCGHPIEAPIEGGRIPCEKCQVELDVPERPDVRIPPSGGGDELARRERLRAQDGRPLMPPAGCESLTAGGNQVPPYKLDEAHRVWGATCSQLRRVPGDPMASERLNWLTVVLRNSYDGDERMLRALAEGAVEAMPLPRHRQQLIGHIVRGAARAHDFEAAEEWLALCDPASEELATDSAYRVSRAMLDTARGDFARVIETLGATFEEVPVEDSIDPIAVVLRANALERSGRVEDAKAELAKFMSRGNSAMIHTVIELCPREWRLCSLSIEAASTQAREATGERAAEQSGSAMGWLLLGAGVVMPVGMGAFFLFDGGTPPIMLLPILIVPVITGTLGARMILQGRRAREIAKHGLHGKGTIVAVSRTGTKINGVPLMQIDVEVEVDGHAPVVASFRRLMRGGADMVGRQVKVIWHPKYPSDVVLE